MRGWLTELYMHWRAEVGRAPWLALYPTLMLLSIAFVSPTIARYAFYVGLLAARYAFYVGLLAITAPLVIVVGLLAITARFEREGIDRERRAIRAAIAEWRLPPDRRYSHA